MTAMPKRELTWQWMARRILGLPAICPACLHPVGRRHRCDWLNDPPPSSQWRFTSAPGAPLTTPPPGTDTNQHQKG